MTEYVTAWKDHEPTKLHWGVPVVRCRDCAYSIADGNGCGRLSDYTEVEPDGFCAWGERRECRMSMLSAQAYRLRDRADELRMLASGMDAPYIVPSTKETMALAMQSAASEMREAADTIISLRDRLQAVGETCSIEWSGESYDTDIGREFDGAYFCTKCMTDLPQPLQECWDDYQTLMAHYGNVKPWNEKPFLCCPNCGRKVVDE